MTITLSDLTAAQVADRGIHHCPREPRPRRTGAARDELVEGMYVFVEGPVADDTLEVGEKMELEFRDEAVDAGDATISCHVHATVDADDVFPRSAGANGSSTLTVRP